MSTPERIAQFEKMAAADPTNEMAHFSLGNACLQAGRHAEAVRSLDRVIELSPGLSKAYQLCGQAMIGAGWEDRAFATLSQGYEVAVKRGDRMVELAIERLLASIGRPVPKVERPTQGESTSPEGGSFNCRRTGRAGTQLPSPPMRGPVGEWIHANISAETWREWIGQGTKVINEMRLDFSREKDQEVYEQHMFEYLGIDESVLTSIGVTRA
jgi:Fe-S cluster biosynthesis and repair protein YggX